MKQFIIGDLVTALTNPASEIASQPRKKGESYKVFDVKYCVKCGHQMIYLGLKNERKDVPFMKCTCGSVSANGGRQWTKSELFILKGSEQYELEKALEDEDYAKACLLRDMYK